MKVLYDIDGFIWRDEMQGILKLTGMTEIEFIFAMEHDFEGVTFHEASKIVQWFQGNQYFIDPVKNFDYLPADDFDDMLWWLNEMGVSIIGIDKDAGYVLGMEYVDGIPGQKFFKLVENEPSVEV